MTVCYVTSLFPVLCSRFLSVCLWFSFPLDISPCFLYYVPLVRSPFLFRSLPLAMLFTLLYFFVSPSPAVLNFLSPLALWWGKCILARLLLRAAAISLSSPAAPRFIFVAHSQRLGYLSLIYHCIASNWPYSHGCHFPRHAQGGKLNCHMDVTEGQ